jgi:hypothetical protein
MRIFINVKPGVILAGLSVLLFSCTPQSCFESTESFLKASLYLNKTGKLLAPDSLTVYGTGQTTNKLYDKAKSVTIAEFPLNSSSTKCTFFIKINGVTDTIQFKYTNYPHLISKECGYSFYHNLYDSLTYSRNIIDSIFIRNNNITTLNEENIRIFY